MEKTRRPYPAGSGCYETPEQIMARQARQYNETRGEDTDGYDCPLCLNRTFIMADDGSVALCACTAIRRSLRRLRQQGLGPAVDRLTLENFRTDAPWQRQLKDAVTAYLAQPAPGWLFLGGQSGCGKTHLCTAAVVTLCKRGLPLRYMRWMNDTAELKTLSMDARRTTILRDLITTPLLYIDDLFKSMPTEADRHIAFELLGARASDPSCITLLSSERTLPEILAIDEALGGRIAERCGPLGVLNIARDPSRNMRMR